MCYNFIQVYEMLKTRNKTAVAFLTAVSILIFSPPVLAALSGKCCMKKQMKCHAAGRDGKMKHHKCRHAGTDGDAVSKAQADHSRDPVSCCEKHCYPQLAKTAQGKTTAHEKALSGQAVTVSPVRIDSAFIHGERFNGQIRHGPLLSRSSPLYSLHSAYLI